MAETHILNNTEIQTGNTYCCLMPSAKALKETSTEQCTGQGTPETKQWYAHMISV